MAKHHIRRREAERLRKRCGASKVNGEPCQKWANVSGRCRLHGGATPRGMDNPSAKTGRYSRYLKDPSLREKFEVARADDRLFELDEEGALLQMFIAQELEELQSPVDFEKLGRLVRELAEAED